MTNPQAPMTKDLFSPSLVIGIWLLVIHAIIAIMKQKRLRDFAEPFDENFDCCLKQILVA